MTADRRPTRDGAAPGASTADPFGRANAWDGPAPRMREVTHVHADHDPRAWHWFARGPLVAADGGERPDEADDAEPRAGRDVEDEQIRDVSHEPTHGEGANRVWDRGEDEDDAV